MSYNLKYTANFTNEQNQSVEVKLYQEGGTGTVENYHVTALKINVISDEQDLYATIITKELELSLWCEDGQSITWESFITSSFTKWKVTVDVDGFNEFTGFLTPEESSGPLQDKPYEINLMATDGLGLLKGYELRDVTDAKFDDLHFLIEYIAGALYKTGLNLPIRIYSCLFWNSNLDKGDGAQYDMFNQNLLNWRTFLKDSTTFENCYDALKILFGGWCSIQQFNGKWQIMLLSERQYVPDKWYWVEYDELGVYDSSGNTTSITDTVGKNEAIYPINESQIISSRIAYKSTRASFMYEMPLEYVNNQALGNLGSFISAANAYNVVGWTHYKGQPTSQSASSVTPYIKVDLDAFNHQTDRYYIVPKDTSAPTTQLEDYIRNDNADFYVQQGDRMSISVTYRTKFDESTNNLYQVAFIILKEGASGSSTGDWYSLDNSGAWLNTPNGVFGQYNITEDTTNWLTASLSDLVLPYNGQAWLLLGNGNVDVAGNESHFKDIKIDITPYIRGSVFDLKGDYHKNAQTTNYPDSLNEEIKISDSPRKMIKGSLFGDVSGTKYLITTSWCRYPNSEVLNFKQAINYGRYNQGYRRFYRIEGDFTGLNQLSFHKQYNFVDLTPDRKFVFIPSLEMDLLTGNFNGTFVEVYKDSNDGTQTGSTNEFNYIFQ